MAPPTVVCPECSEAAPAGARFCPSCGGQLGAARAPMRISDAERRTATVLFADLSGYTELNELLDPEDVAVVMAEIKDGATRILESHGGTVNQFVGDQVMALFGVPLAHDEDPVRAVTAALALHEFMRGLAAELEPRTRRLLALHTAVNTGVVLAQRRDRREGVFGVTGDAINTGARLAGIAGRDEIVVGPETFQAIEPYFATELVGDVQLRGKAEPLRVHRVRGRVARTRFEVAQRRGLSQLVGRVQERGLFRGALEALSRGQGGLVTVAGEAGVGKSRLFHEFQTLAADHAFAAYRARCEAFGSIEPYAPFVQLLRDALDLSAEASHEQTVLDAVTRLRALGPELERRVAAFLHLLSLRSSEHPLGASQQGEALRGEILDALTDLLAALARSRPVVLLLEDWHWADPASELALANLLGRSESLPILFAVNYRRHFRPAWARRSISVDLAPLLPDEAGTLIDALVGQGGLPGPWRRRIQERTGGNPFFIEELCRAVSGKQPAELAESLLALDSVEGTLRARIDRLDRRSVAVLREASVLGTQFSLAVLRRLDPADDLSTCLHQLEDAQLLRSLKRADDTAYQFEHGLTRDVAYQMLLRRDRAALHDAVGRALEEHFAGARLEAHFEELAHHFSQGEDWGKAVFYLESAGHKAARSFAMEAARGHYARAVSILAGSERTLERCQKRIDLTFRWTQAGWYGPSAGQIEALEQAQQLAREIGDPLRELRCEYFIGWLHYTMGNSALAIPRFERCLEHAAPSDPRMLSQLLVNLGQNLANDVEYGAALEHLERGIALRRKALPERWQSIGMAYALAYIGLVHADRGDLAASARVMDEAFSIIDPLGHTSALSSLNQVRAIAAGYAGEWEKCLEYTALGREIASTIGAPPNHAMAVALEGWCRFIGRGDASGIAGLERGMREMEAAGTGLGLSLYLACAAEACARTGDLERGEHYARRSLERSAVRDRVGHAQALRALALCEARRGNWAAAEQALELGRQHAEEKGSPRDALLNELCLAECLHARGDDAAASACAEAAVGPLRAMGLRGYVPIALELAGLGS
ncbi:MAG TPA: AAA family ATPase [Myxococcota bacterium]|nr:AAA family ATPase [Myxococcota bacterium]